MIKLDTEEVPATVFPDGTVQVWNLPDRMLNNITTPIIEWTYESDSELVILAQLKSLLSANKRFPELYIYFLPYARQDKTISNNQTFGLNSFATLLNAIGFKRVVILDPHSNRATQLINNSEAYYPTDSVKQFFKDTRSDVVLYPDAGATSKYREIYKGLPWASAQKVRDQAGGKIISSGLAQQAVNEVRGKRVLIVDDICDGGATFISLAHSLKMAGATNISLYVTYGIFSKGLDVLTDAGIKDIAATVSLRKVTE